MALPKSLINADAVRKAQTFSYFRMGEEDATLVQAYREDDDYLYVPRQYGVTLCQSLGIAYEDCTSAGVPVKFPKTPAPRPEQAPVIDQILKTADSYYDFMFRARTGFGKTISSLIVAARRGVSTMVLVDQENLRDQWIETLVDKFGFRPHEVGLVQGRKLEFQGKAVTVGMIQTLRRDELPQELLDYFGLLLVDEVHTAGAPTFSSVLTKFSATLRIGVSATPKRKDGLQKALESNLGKVRVYVADEHKKSVVYVAEHPTVYSWYANSSPKAGRYIAEISDDGSRNLLVAESAVMLLDSGRDTLVLSDRIEQLTHLYSLCRYLGVPEEDMGLYTGQQFAYEYVKQSAPPRRPSNWDRQSEYSPVELKLISKKTPKAKLKEVKESAKLIFATYQMFAKGVDVPRLTGGVDATPRANAEQIHGRILRQPDGAQSAIWVTISDTNSYRSLNQLVGRIQDYAKNNAALFELQDDGSAKPCQRTEILQQLRERVETLKSARVETLYAGLYTLKFPESPKLLARRDGSGIRLSRLRSESLPTDSYVSESSEKSPTKRRIILSPSSRSRSPSSRRP